MSKDNWVCILGKLITFLLRFSAVVIGGNGDPQEVISSIFALLSVFSSQPLPGGVTDPQSAF